MSKNNCDHLVAVRADEGGMTSFHMSAVRDATRESIEEDGMDVFTYCPYCGVKIPYATEVTDADCQLKLVQKLKIGYDMVELVGTNKLSGCVTRIYQAGDGNISYRVESCGAKILGITKHEVLE